MRKYSRQIHAVKVAIALAEVQGLGAAADNLRELLWRLEGEDAAGQHMVFRHVPMPERA